MELIIPVLPNVFLLIKNAAFRQKWVFLTAFIILFCFWLVLQHTAQQGVARSLAEQDTSNAVLLHALEDTVVRSFQSVNTSMQTLAESLPQLSSTLAIESLLTEQLRISPQLRAIDLLDTQGLVIASVTKRKGSIANYSCFDTLKSEPLLDFVIESPQKGRYPNDPYAETSTHRYLPFCVPVRDANQQLINVLVASINPQYFYNLFSSITDTFAAHIHLYRYDGEGLLIASSLEPKIDTVLQQLKEKSWGQYRTSIEEVNYLVSYRSTSLLPLILVLVSNEELALASWRHDEKMMRLFLMVISLFTLGVALVIAVIQEKRWRARGDIQLLSTAIRSAANAIVITNRQGDIHWTNKAFTELTGYTFKEVNGKNPRILNSGFQSKAFFKELWETILAGKSWRGELINRHKTGHTMVVDQTVTPILDAKNNIEHFIAVHEDVTARKYAEQKALYLADHDSLTDLPNRRYFERHLNQIFIYSEQQTEIAVLFIDLDRFKDINDAQGHEAGDALLIHTTSNLQSLMSENHLLARLGGDEFAILVKNVTSQRQLNSFASKVVRVVAKPFHYGDSIFNITCSVGVATGATQTSDASKMLRQADMAMYRAKHAGKNTYRFFDEAMDALIKRRVYLQQQLEVAIKSESAFSLRYQPQINTATNAIYGAEALMRWEVAEGEWVSPFEFITLAEETGQILEIGAWLMKNLFQQMVEWNRRGIQFGKISMNISAVQLARDTLAERMLGLMKDYAIPAEQLCVEITETTLMTDSERVMDNLKQLKKAGIALSIDDFGTGYSSMSYLKAIDADHLKIDRSFIVGIGEKDSDEHIIRATIALAHSLKLETVAEDVDSQEQLAFLKALDCDYIQGYHFSKPLTVEDFEQFLEKGC